MNNFQRLRLTEDQGVVHLQLNCPDEYNRMTPEFWVELPEAMRAIDQLSDARVVVVSAQGKHFCAGLDLSSKSPLAEKSGLEDGRFAVWLREYIMWLQASISAIENARVPVIAAVQGACIGGGVALVSACDMRYCSSDAFFSIEETNIGITCDVGSLQRLPHIISQTHLREWVYSGRRLTASKAEEWGLVGGVYDSSAQMMDEVNKLAAEISAKSPLVLHGSKLSLNYSRDHTIAAGLDHVAMLNAGILRGKEISIALKKRDSDDQVDFPDLEPRIEITRGL